MNSLFSHGLHKVTRSADVTVRIILTVVEGFGTRDFDYKLRAILGSDLYRSNNGTAGRELD